MFLVPELPGLRKRSCSRKQLFSRLRIVDFYSADRACFSSCDALRDICDRIARQRLAVFIERKGCRGRVHANPGSNTLEKVHPDGSSLGHVELLPGHSQKDTSSDVSARPTTVGSLDSGASAIPSRW